MQSKKKSKAQQYRDLVAKILEETVITSDEKLAEEVRRRIGAKRFTMNEYKSALALKDPRIDYTKSGSELIFYKPGVTAFIENLQSGRTMVPAKEDDGWAPAEMESTPVYPARASPADARRGRAKADNLRP